MRYERKYRVEDCSTAEVLQIIRNHRSSFTKAYPDRHINSLYLDTYDFNYFKDNISGISNRTKQRIRWYGDDLKNIANPILEIKLKENELGSKQYVRLPNFKIDRFFSYEGYLKQHLWLATNHITPTVMIRYLRSYYKSWDKQIRLTIDQQIRYYPVDHRLNFNITPYRDAAIILELKYKLNPDNNRNIDYITQDFPFRLTRNSKYINALQMCY